MYDIDASCFGAIVGFGSATTQESSRSGREQLYVREDLLHDRVIGPVGYLRLTTGPCVRYSMSQRTIVFMLFTYEE